MSSQVEHTDVGAYALGLLEEADRRAFSAHLSGCPSCTAELAELSGTAAALVGIEPVEDEEDKGGDRAGEAPAQVIDLIRRKQAADRRARRRTFLLGAAAAVVLVGGGVTVGATISGGGAAPGGHHSAHGPAEEFYRQGKPIAGTGVSGVSGGLVLETKAWGTHAALELKGVRGPLECELVAVSKTGERRVVTGWAVPEKGYGVPGSPEPLYVHGGTAFSPGEIDRFEVSATGGGTLLTVDV
ncbi:anti-sigma factor family protein [Streptosporangium sp. NPDC000396]|uniref:anti-sigma factor family protein n=1 Tax=Streptosporangium sp. NPDC000396 TaxID=3366185 RepID=UPI0036AFE0B9